MKYFNINLTGFRKLFIYEVLQIYNNTFLRNDTLLYNKDCINQRLAVSQ